MSGIVTVVASPFPSAGREDQRRPGRSVGPSVYAVNRTAASHDIALTLLTVAFVDDIARIAGFGRVLSRTDIHIAGLPVLRLEPPGEAPIDIVDGNLRHDRGGAWIAWVCERPAHAGGVFQARIEQLEVASTIGRWRPEPVVGPWLFTFRLPLVVRPVTRLSRFD